MMGAESSEYNNLRRRNFGLYSDGHRAMYDAPCTLIRKRKARILDIGSGIGYGLQRMQQEECIKEYVGVEPDDRSIEYTRQLIGRGISFIHSPWPCEVKGEFDFVFCIEVIEHVAPALAKEFICAMRPVCKRALFFSTPDPNQTPHGTLAPSLVTHHLREAGFAPLHLDWQWTVFYIGAPI